MGALSLFKKRPDPTARFTVLRKFVWGPGFASIGDLIFIGDPALARELVNASKVQPFDEHAREFLKQPAKWIEPRTTAISPRGAGVFSREQPWRPL